ncbi:MAG: glycosyltransferase family 2 protein [Desulfobulbaceae bacterium]|nr:glycosyltransferase family 2 protein [Desulfobulbaceae bacterium]
MHNHNLEISIVLPAFNEEENIRPIYEVLTGCLRDLSESFEIIFVDDGSTDSTALEITKLKEKDSSVRLIKLVRNFGHQSAVYAGLEKSKGRSVVTMDCDLQHPPRLLGQMIEKWRSGYKLVQMVRKTNRGESLAKRMFSALFYKIINKFSETPVSPNVADFMLMDRMVVDELLRINDTQPFIRGVVNWFGFASAFIEYDADSRHGGLPSYNFKQNIQMAQNAFTMLSNFPLRVGLYAGAISIFVCMLYMVVILYSYINGRVIDGWTSLIASILFLGSVQLVVVGIIGEYVGQLFKRSRNLPPFVAFPEE